MLYFLDANIVIFSIEGPPVDQQRARNHIAALEAAGHRFVVSGLMPERRFSHVES